jgi:hypothetical protein
VRGSDYTRARAMFRAVYEFTQDLLAGDPVALTFTAVIVVIAFLLGLGWWMIARNLRREDEQRKQRYGGGKKKK